MNIDNQLKVAITAVKEGIKVAHTFINDAQIFSNEKKDIKTKADLSVNDSIINCLSSFSSCIPILSEEIPIKDLVIPKLCWIIDPLDGTYNFTRKYPNAAVSICLWENNRPVIGVVGDIFNGTIYKSVIDERSYKDEKVITVSIIKSVKNATLATGFPSGSSFETDNLLAFVRQVQSFKKVRAIGSASLMLCNVASGIFDAYYENDIYLWDVAAGLALVQEAGGKVFYKRRPNTFKYEVLATNKFLFEEAQSKLVQA